MRNAWKLILVGVAIFSVAVWQHDWIASLAPEPVSPLICAGPDCPRGTEYEYVGFVMGFAVGYVLPAGMVVVGVLGLTGRGPAARNRTEPSEVVE